MLAASRHRKRTKEHRATMSAPHPVSAQSPTRGIVAMLVGTAFLIGSDAVSKHLAGHQPIGQLICVRQIVSLGFILAFAWATTGLGALRMVNMSGQLIRAVLFVVTTTLVVVSLRHLPIATVTAIGFTSPIWVAAIAGPSLGEKVTLRRWLAIVGGFLGVLLIIQPGSASFSWLLMLPAVLAVVSAFRDVLTRYLSRTDTAIGILFWSSLMVIGASALTLPWGWEPISKVDAGWYVLNGLFSATAHFLMITAYRLADAALVASFRYSGQVWAIILGALIWQHFPDALSLVGSFVIICSGVAMIERERRAAPKIEEKPAARQTGAA